MRTSQYLLATVKETPSDAEVISHKLLLRAGMIRKLSSGIYTWLPLGLRVLKKVEAIVRDEMNRAGAIEILMPMVQAAELWHESGRWDAYGAELLRLQDRHEHRHCLGPTHEEVITHLLRYELRSYKQLPRNFYQIQTKFRDEIRPRFGIMRAREFIMKDAYSFHRDTDSLQTTYDRMYQAYSRIFQRIGLHFKAVLAETGSIGGNYSHEFQVLAKSGEDKIAVSEGGQYAANVELAEAMPPSEPRQGASDALSLVATPGQRTIADICKFLKLPIEQTVKTLLVIGKEHPVVALIIRGDHELNPFKAEKLPDVKVPITFLTPEQAREQLHCDFGSLGPVNFPFPVIADHSAAHASNFSCGANKNDKHYINVNWGRDCPEPKTADLRMVQDGDISPMGDGRLHMSHGIEVGHIFQLGNKYSKTMGATVLDEQGCNVEMQMGCYGIGISRIVAAAIEQCHDEQGIQWPASIAPFEVVLIPINMQKSQRLRFACDSIYEQFQQAGIDILFDDRNERPGVLFADADLIGIPHRLVLSDKGIDSNTIEYKARGDKEKQDLPLTDIVNIIRAKLYDHKKDYE